MEHFRSTFCCIAPTSLRSRFGNRTPEELKSLEHFQNRTVPMLAGYFPSDVWTALPLCLSETEPAILLAVMALSAYHGQSLGSKNLDTTNAVSRFALQHYTAAIALFRERSQALDLPSLANEVGCLLFACIEFLRGYGESALVHISGAVGFISSRQAVSQSRREEISLTALLSRLSLRQSMYGWPRRCVFPPLLEVPNTRADARDHRFYNLAEARMASTALMLATFRLSRMTIEGSIGLAFEELSVQKSLQQRLKNWSLAFESFIASAGGTIQDSRGPCLLRVHHLLAATFLVDPFPDRESAFDACTDHFNNIVTILDDIISQDRRQWGHKGHWPFSLDTGIIPALFFTAIKCRDTSIRRRAVDLLDCVPRCEGMWDAQEAARAAQLAIEFEESHRTGVPDASVPTWARLQDVDINRRDEDDPRRQLVVLRWRPDGMDGPVREVHRYIQW